MEKLTMQEEEVMRLIWQIGPCFVKDILAKYADPKPTYEYTPLIPESEYKRTFMSGVVRNYFEDSYKEMVSFFAKDQKISAEDLKDIIDLIEKGKE